MEFDAVAASIIGTAALVAIAAAGYQGLRAIKMFGGSIGRAVVLLYMGVLAQVAYGVFAMFVYSSKTPAVSPFARALAAEALLLISGVFWALGFMTLAGISFPKETDEDAGKKKKNKGG